MRDLAYSSSRSVLAAERMLNAASTMALGLLEKTPHAISATLHIFRGLRSALALLAAKPVSGVLPIRDAGPVPLRHMVLFTR